MIDILFYFFKYLPHQNRFQIKVVDRNEVCVYIYIIRLRLLCVHWIVIEKMCYVEFYMSFMQSREFVGQYEP
jgi:hypothetical protein